MSDNVTTVTNVGATVPAGTTIAADLISGAYYQNIKVGYGGDDSWTYVSTSAGLPVAQQGSWTVTADQGGSWTVAATQSGTWNVDQAGTWTVRIVGNAGSTVDAAIGPGTAPTNMLVVGGIYQSPEISLSAGQTAALQTDPHGYLKISLRDAAGNARGANVNASNQLSVSLDGGDGATVAATQSGTWSVDQAGSWSVSITGTPAVTQSGTWTVATNADATPGSSPPSKALLVAGSDGTDARTIKTDSSGNVEVSLANTAANSTPILTTQTPATSGGSTIYRLISAASTNSNNIKSSAGQLYGFIITNINASARFVKLYNKASAPTIGTDTPVMTLQIPGNSSGSGMVAAEFVSGIAFGTGIGIGITANVADTDTTAISANDVIVNLFYK